MHEDHDDDSNEDIKNEIENELWEKFKIDFQLEASEFPDNKIYGIINIEPEEARKLIKNFELVVNKKKETNFDSNYKNLCASGFNIINQDEQSVCIQAIPKKPHWSPQKKTSEIRDFRFTGKVFTLSASVSFDWSNGKNTLVIQWYHIGDKYAHTYILYLDGKAIQYIRQKLFNEDEFYRFDVRIEDLKVGEKYTLQIAAKLNNGKETYRSDPVDFIVPKQERQSTQTKEIITVSDDPIPPNLPVYVATNDDKTPEKPKPDPIHPPQPIEKPKPDLIHPPQPIEKPKPDLIHPLQPIEKPKQHTKTYTCCNNLPHKTFPGIEHYFKKMPHRISCSEESSDDDDDNDVVVVTSKN